MSKIIEVPLINPIKLFKQQEFISPPASAVSQTAFNANYNTTPFDKDWFINRLTAWEDQVEYLQPFQKGDKIVLQWQSEVTSTATDFEVSIIDCNGKVIKGPLNPSVQTVSGFNFFTINVALWDVPEGKYFVQLKYIDTTEQWFISEPIHVKELHKDTLLIEYWNSYNAHSVFFEQSGVKFQLRIHGEITEMQPNSQRETYEDQPLSAVLLSGRPYREWKLKVGVHGYRISEWYADKVSRSFDCDNTRLDNDYYTAMGDSKLEPRRIEGMPLAAWEMPLRDRYNTDTVSIDDLGYYNLGALPPTDRFYVQGFQFTIPSTPSPTTITIDFERGFTGVKNFIDFLNNTTLFADNGFFDFNGGYFAQNEVGELIFIYGDQTEKDQWLYGTPGPTLIGILPYWHSVEITSVTGDITDLDIFFTGAGNRAVEYGDGNTEVYGTGNTNHTYGNVGKVEAFLYYDTQTAISLKSGGDYRISSLGGQVSPVLTSLSSRAEVIRVIKNDLFKFANGAFTTLDLSDNTLPVSQIDKIIVMLRNAQIKNLLPSGTADISGQTPSAPPSTAVMPTLGILQTLFTITHD